MTLSMKNKFDKYWGNVDKMNKLIYLAAVLDPRSKLCCAELTLTDIYGEEIDKKLANDVKEFACSLFDDYRNKYASVVP